MTMDAPELADDETHAALYDLIAEEHQRTQTSQGEAVVAAVQEAA